MNRRLIWIPALAAALAVSACKGEVLLPPCDDVPVSPVGAVDLRVGQSFVVAAGGGCDRPVPFTLQSRDTAVVRVQPNGTVTAVGVGETGVVVTGPVSPPAFVKEIVVRVQAAS